MQNFIYTVNVEDVGDWADSVVIMLCPGTYLSKSKTNLHKLQEDVLETLIAEHILFLLKE